MRELISILQRFEGSRVRGNGRAWRLEGSSADVEECKTKLLDAICSQSQPLVCYDESPVGIRELQDAGEVARGIWRLPARAPGSVVLSWLSMGNWQLYVAEAPIAAIPDLCRSPDDDVERFVVDTGVSVIIDSFHDDVSWVVGLKSNGQPSVPLDALQAARR